MFLSIPAVILVTIWNAPGHSAIQERDEAPLENLFRSEVAQINSKPLQGFSSFEAWKNARPELQRQLQEMLGLDPFPERTPLNVEIRSVVDRPDFKVETLLFESLPGLEVTGNLYRPKTVDDRLPAILYVCGHGRVERDGVIYGNKAHYQHHAAWYAANGYICLVVDTLQLGEVPGLHHGTHREGKWWWQSRGYTPAGIETWNGIRAIDYLISRPEVDPSRIGVTGRSGGGATSWWLGALDDRLAAVIPVAGITDLYDHVVEGDDRHPHGVIEGHCDCMYMVNTYRWDFPTLAALVAPKPLLLENTNRDPIFPLAGVKRIYEQLEKVYDWYNVSNRLDLVIGEGGHVDSEEIRHPSFAFMERWLKQVERNATTIEEPDRTIPIADLKVLEINETRPHAKNSKIDETFVNRAELPKQPESKSEWQQSRQQLLSILNEKVFGGWPEASEVPALTVKVSDPKQTRLTPVNVQTVDYISQEGLQLRTYVFTKTQGELSSELTIPVLILGEDDWGEWVPIIKDFEDPSKTTSAKMSNLETTLERNNFDQTGILAVVVPRGIGPTAWAEGSTDVHIRRRFALLGQTLHGMRVWDILRALKALDQVSEFPSKNYQVSGKNDAASLALWVGIFEPKVERIVLTNLPDSIRTGPAYLNLERLTTMPEIIALMYPRQVTLITESRLADWLRRFDAKMPRNDWLKVVTPD